MSADERNEAEQASESDHARPGQDGNGVQNRITDATVDNAIQAGVIHGDIHIHSHAPQPALAPQQRMSPATNRAYRALFGTPPIVRLVRCLFRITAARSPALLWAAFSFFTALVIGALLSAALAGPGAKDAASDDLSLALGALLFAVVTSLIILQRHRARRRDGHTWPSLAEVHPKLAARLERTSTLVTGVVLFPLLALGFVPSDPTGRGAAMVLAIVVWMLEAALACVGALVHRRRTAQADQR